MEKKYRIVKTKKYNIYPSGDVYKGNKLIKNLTELEHDYITSIGVSGKQRDAYIEDQELLERDMHADSFMIEISEKTGRFQPKL